MRYEAKYKEIKAFCKVNFSRINKISRYSCAVKTALKLAHRLFNNESFEVISDVKGITKVYSEFGNKYYFLRIRSHASHIEDNHQITVFDSVNFKGTDYQKKAP